MFPHAEPGALQSVLIVEDDTDAAEALEEYLAPHGFKTHVVQTLGDAERALSDDVTKVVLLDVRLGSEHGLDLIGRMHGSRPDLLFIVMTAFADTEVAIQALKLGAHDFLRKPFDPISLARTLGRTFDLLRAKQDRETALMELRRSEARLRQALDIAELGTFEWQPAKRQLSLSLQASRIYGIADADGAGYQGGDERLTSAIHPEDAPRVRKAIQQALESSGQFKVEFRIQQPDGPARNVESQAQLIQNEPGQPDSMLGIVRDVTASRRIEQQLRQAQKMEAVGTLAGGVAHDLNNMLQIIRGYVELSLLRSEGQPTLSEALRKVIVATDSASKLIQQLLAFSRSQVLRMRPVDLNELIATQLQMLRRIIRQDIEIEAFPADAAAVVQADPGMVEQVIVNLCVNARDAMPDGGKLTLSLSHQEVDDAFRRSHDWARHDRYIVLVVSDTGIGMEAETLQRVFEPFFTTKEQGKGTGLGLAMVYGIVQQHGGTITVESRLGVGTAFTIYLPSQQAVPLREQAPTPAHVEGGSETVLVAEDEEAVRQLVIELLTSQGYRVLSAADGEEALAVFREHRDEIGLALLDIVMPKLGGLAVYQQLMALRPDLPVLFSTGYAGEEEDRAFVANSGVTTVRKPYTPADLFQAVRRVLDGRG